MRSFLVRVALLFSVIAPPAQGAAPPGTPFTGTWTPLPPAPPPPPGPRPAQRMGTGAIVDPSRDRLVLFGGWGAGTYFDDTWALDLGSDDAWTPLAVGATRPAPRLLHAAIHDPVRDRMLVFGGKNPYSDELWSLSLSGAPSWSPVATSGTRPFPRETSAIYDPVRDRMILFGGHALFVIGQQNIGVYLNDTWAIDLSGSMTWYEPLAFAPPSARTGHSMIYDLRGDRLVVFGGIASIGGALTAESYKNDVWTLDLATLTWRQLSPSGTAPPGRYGHSATYDPDRHEMVVFGGYGPHPPPLGDFFRNDTYVLSLGENPAWTRVETTIAPSRRDFHSTVYDAARRRVVLFSGNMGPAVADVWAFDTGTRTWSQIGPLPPVSLVPPARFGSLAVHDLDDRRMVLFGGRGIEDLDDTWTLSLESDPPRWKPHPLMPRPAARLEHATAYDAARDRMLLFGGRNEDEYYGDLWQLDLEASPRWSLVSTSGPAPRPRETRAVFDPVRDQMIVFGGAFESEHFNDTWALDFSGIPTWRKLDPRGRTPAPRRGHSLVYDPVGDKVVLFGGHDGTRFLDDVWELHFRGQPTWTEVTPPLGGPAPRSAHSATYDPVHGAMVVIGGSDGSPLDDAWVLQLERVPRWTRLEADSRPGPVESHTVIHDPDRDRLLLFGGSDGQPLGDLWQLGISGPGPAPPGFAAIPYTEHLFALAGAVGHAGSDVLVVRCSLPDVSPARLELFDVAGRRLTERVLTPRAAGPQEVDLSGSGGLRAGIYLVRLSQGPRRAVSRVVMTP